MEYNKQIGLVQIDNLIVLFSFLLTVMTGLAISHGDSTLATGSVHLILAISIDACLFLLGFLIIFYKHKLAFLVIIPFVYWIYINLDSYSGASWSIVLLFELTLFCAMSNNLQEKTYDLYKKYLVIISAIGIICYVVYVLNVPIPHNSIAYYSSWQPSASYISYGVCYLYSNTGTLRLCGLFNEPGYLGTILALLLCVEKFSLKKKDNIILFIAGLLTFSAAFYAIAFIYIMLLSYKKPKIMVPMMIAMIFYICILPKIPIHNADVAYLISRFSFSNGTFLGDNRSKEALDVVFSEVLSGKNIVFGFGGGYVSSLAIQGGVSSYKSYIVDYGMFGFLLLYVPLIWAAIKRAEKNLYALFFVLCFVINIYQRPGIYALPYLVILFGGIEHRKRLDNDENKEERL